MHSNRGSKRLIDSGKKRYYIPATSIALPGHRLPAISRHSALLLAPANAKTVVPSQPILSVGRKPALVLEPETRFFRGFAAIDIAIFEGWRVTG
jgi:hypothetical protein